MTENTNRIITGDCLERMKEIPDGSVDLVCTDPPYGYSFMGKDWDRAVPSVEVWRECLRVLKPGGFAFVMSAPRSDVQCAMISRLQDAGFRVDFTPIYWAYATGFPKAMHIAKSIGKITDEVCNEIKSAWSANIATQPFQDLLAASETGTTFVAHYAEALPKQLRLSVRAEVVSESREAFGFKQIDITVPESALMEVCERALSRIKGGGASKIEHGNPKSLRLVDTSALCVELIESWKHTISSALQTDPICGTTLQTASVSATNVTITASTMELLITSTVDMLAKKLGGERVSVPSKRHGGGSSEIFEERGTTDDEVSNHPLAGSFAGFQPKPAVEVVIVAMKPLSERTYVDQAMRNRKGITWLDDARIPTAENLNGGAYSDFKDKPGASFYYEKYGKTKIDQEFKQPTGRFPANLLVSDDVLNDGTVTATKRIESPSAVSDEGNTWGGTFQQNRGARGHSDSGSFSRYFDLDAWGNTLPFLIVPKASKAEKNRGLDSFPDRPASGLPMRSAGGDRGGEGMDGSDTDRKTVSKNTHNTVKPLKLMSYLVTLGSREGDTVLDPFAGSGTTCLAAKELKRNYIGIEREEEYVRIAEARLSHEPLTLFTQFGK